MELAKYTYLNFHILIEIELFKNRMYHLKIIIQLCLLKLFKHAQRIYKRNRLLRS